MGRYRSSTLQAPAQKVLDERSRRIDQLEKMAGSQDVRRGDEPAAFVS